MSAPLDVGCLEAGLVSGYARHVLAGEHRDLLAPLEFLPPGELPPRRTPRATSAPRAELARAHINGQTDGLLKLVADPSGRLVGAHVVGEAAIELVHVAQMALVGNLTLEAFVDHVFNFPTMAEAYRVAALDAVARMSAGRARAA